MLNPKEALIRQIHAALPRAMHNLLGENVAIKYDGLDDRFSVILTPDQASRLCWPEDNAGANRPLPMSV